MAGLVKAKQYSVAESNIALLGSELEKKCRLAGAAGEEQWKNAGKVPGLQIWRIQNFKVAPIDPKTYGSFYSGDSYIILNTYKKNPNSPALAWDIHFWLGSSTTQDEAGTAAYKTVEADDFLGGSPIEHREVQDHESHLFLTYFPKGIMVLEGGIDSGFKHVGPKDYKPRLLRLKGKRHIRLTEVPCKLSSVNSGDVFVLDLGTKLIQFNGGASAPLERSKAAEIVSAINDEREGRTTKIVFEENDKSYPEEWTQLLGKGAIAPASAGGDDLAFEKGVSTKQLFKVSDASGKLQMTKVAEGAAVKKELLDKMDVFIVDFGNEVFAWVGSKASVAERKWSMRYAEDYLKQTSKPAATPISRVLDGSESNYFWSLLSSQ